MKKLLYAATLLAVSAATAGGPADYREIARLRDLNRGMQAVRPTPDGQHYTVLENNAVLRYAYASEATAEVLLQAPNEDFRLTDYALSPDGTVLLAAEGRTPIYRHSYTTRYYLKDASGLRSILSDVPVTRDASFSPNGRLIAFSSRNDLYLYDPAGDSLTRLTHDGAWNATINGTTDWVYEEEFGYTRAYAFSPDGRQLAYLRFDEREVPLFEMMRYDGTLYNKAFPFKYPKAGEPNSVVTLHLYDIAARTTTRIDTGPVTDQYIPRIGWTPDGRLWFYRLNRRQNHFEVVLCERDGAQRVIYDERSPSYVERADQGTVTFLDDGRHFIVRQETTAGYMHLYLCDIDSGFTEPITQGAWEVTALVGVRGKWVYYLSTELSPGQRDLYRIRLDGSGKERLTRGRAFCSVAPGAGLDYYIQTVSNASSPNRVEVRDHRGKLVRTLEANAELREELVGIALPEREFFDLKTERGDTLRAWMIRPADFDPQRRYPVLMTQYSGPGSQQVSDRWSLDWEDALPAHGYLVVCVDGRGTGFRGERFKKLTYGQMGALEVEDQLSAARYLAALPYVDPARIGIYGWSYGGFMALGCALKGDGLFRMAIAVAPVTSWRYYDSIYTEVYNGLPQDNPSGYDDNSPIRFADRLDDARTRLLLIHGTADDNVHFQNTMEMARALNRTGKKYDMMVYPDQNHSMQPDQTHNVRQKMIDYTLEHL